MKHTPGPYEVTGCATTDRYVRIWSQSQHVANVFTEADARLFAAAPDLLQACKEAADELAAWEEDDDAPGRHVLSLLRAAIAKATE